jgi:hypothetical protein
MAATADAAPVRRKDSEGLPTSSERHSDRDPDAPNGQSGKAVPSNSDRSSTAELGGMILAFIFGGLGFAARIFWIPALVVMAVVFGLILADRRTSRSSKGIVTDIVANVANETRDIFQAAAGTSEEDADEDATKAEEAAPHDRRDPSHAEGSGPGRNASRHLGNGSPQEERDLAAVNGTKTNGDSPARHGGLDLSFTETESKSVTTTGEATVVHDEVERETVKDTCEGTDSAVTEAVQAEIDESVATEAGDAEPESGASDEPRSLPNGSTDSSGRSLPIRLIISADHMAAHSPILRPVRKRMLGVATSLSKTIVQIAAEDGDSSR